MKAKQDKSTKRNRADGNRAVSGSALLRPDSAGGARDALLDGKTIEVPNTMTMKMLRAWDQWCSGKMMLSVEVNGRSRGWTVLKAIPHCR